MNSLHFFAFEKKFARNKVAKSFPSSLLILEVDRPAEADYLSEKPIKWPLEDVARLPEAVH